MSSDTEFRPQAPPHASEDAPTTAIPRPTGPWAPSPVVLGPPHGPQASPPVWQGRPPMRSVPPAGLGPVPPGVPTPPSRPRTRVGWVVVAIVAAIAAVALIGTVAANRAITVTGSVTVYGMYGAVTPGSSCSSTAANGTPVSIYDAAGDLVGTTTLTGYGTARNTWSTYSYGYADSCEYAFTIADVAASDHYRVKAGSGTSDGVGFSREKIENSGAHITVR